MEVSGQIYTPTDLIQEKEHLVRIG